MRRWLRTVSAMLVFLLLFTHAGLFIAEADAADPVFAGGSGTPDDPYVIKTFEQLDAIRQNLAAHYILGADIVLTTEEENGNDGKGFEPIGTNTNKFTGSFDGQWFRIEGLSINRPDENQVGLFGVVGATGELRRVILKNVSITGKNDVGSLAGRLEGGKITDSMTSGVVEGKTYSTGGLVGWSSGDIKRSSAAGQVKGRYEVGGLVGRVEEGAVSESYATAEVDGTSRHTGGLVGLVSEGTVSTSFATGRVNGVEYTGGLAGTNWGKIILSYATGDVYATGDYAGGLLGINTGEIHQNYATGNVFGNNFVGGLVGNSSKDSESDIDPVIFRSYATGRVVGDERVGGLAGREAGRIEQSYATGSAEGQKMIGGLVGDATGHITESYAAGRVDGTEHTGGLTGKVFFHNRVKKSFYDYESTNQWADGDEDRRGTALTTEQMQNKNTFTDAGWDFIDVWAIDPDINGGYPHLKWPEPDPVLSIVMVQEDGTPYTDREWTDQNVTLKVQAMDTFSGLDSLTYSDDGGSTWHPFPDNGLIHSHHASGSLTRQENGSSVIEIRAVSRSGREATAILTINISRGKLSMETVMRKQDGSPYDGNWTNQSVTVAVYAVHEDELTVTSIVYSLDGVTWQEYESPLHFDAEGHRILKVRATDELGNELVGQSWIRIDRTSPVITIDPSGGWAPLAEAAVSVSDSASGVNDSSLEYAWSMDDEPPSEWHSFKNGGPITLSGVNGDWKLHIRARDHAGNSRDVSELFQLDAVAPVWDVSLRMKFDADTGTEQLLSVKGIAQDALSQLSSMMYSLDEGHTWEPYDEEELSHETLHPIALKAVDHAGNDTVVSWESGVLRISTSGLTLRPDAEETGGRLIIRLHADAGRDQIDTMTCWVNGETKPCSPEVPVELEAGKNTSLLLQLTDKLGNRITFDLAVMGNRTPPAVLFSPDGNEDWAAAASSTVTAQHLSGPASLLYAWSSDSVVPEKDWHPFTDGEELRKHGVSGDWYLHVRVRYEDGDTYHAVSGRFRLDHEGPMITLNMEKADGDPYTDDEWVHQPVKITATASDLFSGVRTFLYSLDEGTSWHEYTSPILLEDDGIYRVVFRAVDTAGNETLERRTVRISVSGLILTVTAETEDGESYSAGSWTNSAVTVKAHADSITDNITDFTWRMNHGAEMPYVQDTPLRIGEEGITRLLFRVTDTTGRTLSDEWQVKIDRTAPNVRFGTNGNDNVSTRAATDVHVTDDIEGMDVSGTDPSSLQYVWSEHPAVPESGWQPFVNGETLVKAGVNGNWYLHIQAKDRAGNRVQSVSNPFRLAANGNEGSGGSGGGWSGVVLSDNAELKQLSVRVHDSELLLQPAFAPDIADYTLSTTAGQVDIIAVPAHAKATVKLREQPVDGQVTVSLDLGPNTFEFTVEAEDGSTRQYTLLIHRMTDVVFTDIAGHWAEKDILRAAQAGFVNGYPDGTFRPDRPVTRAEFTVMAASALQLSGDSEPLRFTDQDDIGDWARQAVALSAQHGIVHGYPDGTFRPNANIIRAEMALVIARALGLQFQGPTRTGFDDDEDIPDWASGAIEALRSAGVVVGRGGNRFAPDAPVTRAEAAVLLLRMTDRFSTYSTKPDNGMEGL